MYEYGYVPSGFYEYVGNPSEFMKLGRDKFIAMDIPFMNASISDSNGWYERKKHIVKFRSFNYVSVGFEVSNYFFEGGDRFLHTYKPFNLYVRVSFLDEGAKDKLVESEIFIRLLHQILFPGQRHQNISIYDVIKGGGGLAQYLVCRLENSSLTDKSLGLSKLI